MKQKRQQLLANERIGKLLWRFSLPAIIGMLVNTLYNIVDTIFIGHAVGMLGIAGLSIVFPIQMFILAIGQMVAIGGASLISIALGAKEQDRAELIFGNSFALSILLGFLITIIILPYSSFFLRLFGASATILPYAKAYMDIIMLGAVFSIFNMTSISIIRSEGNANLPMFVMLASAIINTALDSIFIFGFHMGIRGAAIATIISQILAALYILFYFFSGKNTLRLHLKNLIFKISITFEIFALGFASFMRIGATSITTIILNHLLGFYGGDLAIAAYGILNRIIMFIFMPMMGIGQGLQPIVGFNYGAKLFNRVKQATNLSIIATTIFSILTTVVIIIFPQTTIAIFTTDKALIAAGSHALIIIALSLPTLGFQVVVATMFQSLGKAKPSIFLSMLRGVIIFVPLILILPLIWHLNGIWISFPVAFVIAFIITLWMYLKTISHF